MGIRYVIADGSGTDIDITDSGSYNIVVPDSQPKLILRVIDDNCESSITTEICAGLPFATQIDLTDGSNYNDPSNIPTDFNDNAQIAAAVADIQIANPLACGLGTQFVSTSDCDRTTSPDAGFAAFTCKGLTASATGGDPDLETVAVMFDLVDVSSGVTLDTAYYAPTKVTIATHDQIGDVEQTVANRNTGDFFLGASNIYSVLRNLPQMPDSIAGPAGNSGIYVINRTDVGSSVPSVLVGSTTPVAGSYVGGTVLPANAIDGGNRRKNGMGIGGMAIDEENNIIFASLMAYGMIVSIDGTTGVILDQWHPFSTGTDGLPYTGNNDYTSYVEGIGFNQSTRELYFWRGTSNFNGRHDGTRSVTPPYTGYIYSTPVDTAGIITKTAAADNTLQPVPEYTQRGTYSIGTLDNYLGTDETQKNYIAWISNIVFNDAGTLANMNARTATHDGKSWMFTVDGAGDLTFRNLVVVGNDDPADATVANSQQGVGAFISSGYDPVANGSNQDEFFIHAGNAMRSGFNLLSDSTFWGLQIVGTNDQTSQTFPTRHPSTNEADYRAILISEDPIGNNAFPFKGALGAISVLQCDGTGSSRTWELDCECNANEI